MILLVLFVSYTCALYDCELYVFKQCLPAKAIGPRNNDDDGDDDDDDDQMAMVTKT